MRRYRLLVIRQAWLGFRVIYLKIETMLPMLHPMVFAIDIMEVEINAKASTL